MSCELAHGTRADLLGSGIRIVPVHGDGFTYNFLLKGARARKKPGLMLGLLHEREQGC